MDTAVSTTVKINCFIRGTHRMKKGIDLLNGPIAGSLARLALPIMGTSLIQMAYNLTDMLWIGRIGSNAVAAVLSASVLKLNGIWWSISISSVLKGIILPIWVMFCMYSMHHVKKSGKRRYGL